MNPDTLNNLAAAQANFEAAQWQVQQAAERVYDAACTFRNSRPHEEAWLIADHFGEWNSERNHIFWAETDFYEAHVDGNAVRLKTGYTPRCETNTFTLSFPVAWLTLTDEQLAVTLAAEWQKLLDGARKAQVEQDRRATWGRYETYLALKEEFEGKPAPEQPTQ